MLTGEARPAGSRRGGRGKVGAAVGAAAATGARLGGAVAVRARGAAGATRRASRHGRRARCAAGAQARSSLSYLWLSPPLCLLALLLRPRRSRRRHCALPLLYPLSLSAPPHRSDAGAQLLCSLSLCLAPSSLPFLSPSLSHSLCLSRDRANRGMRTDRGRSPQATSPWPMDGRHLTLLVPLVIGIETHPLSLSLSVDPVFVDQREKDDRSRSVHRHSVGQL